MELNEANKESILNPIIDELGIISQEIKDRLIVQISAQMDRIIIKNYGKFVNDTSQNISQLTKIINDLKITQKFIMSTVQSQRQDFDSKLVKLVKSLRAIEKLHKQETKIEQDDQLIEMATSKKKIKVTIDKKKKNKKSLKPIHEPHKEFSKESLEKLSFKELMDIVKENKITIQPRTKRDDIINEILDIKKG